MRLTKLCESEGNWVSIDQYSGKNMLTGYVVDTTGVQIGNFLGSGNYYGISQILIKEILTKYRRMGIIGGITVDEEDRGQGVGNHLLSSAINEAAEEGAEAMILFADTEEENEFDLVKWYEGYGFEKIVDTHVGPMMLMEIDR